MRKSAEKKDMKKNYYLSPLVVYFVCIQAIYGFAQFNSAHS